MRNIINITDSEGNIVLPVTSTKAVFDEEGNSIESILGAKADVADLADVATSGDYDDLENKPSLFSGDYNDLSNKPNLSVYAPINSPALTGMPTAPTANVGTNTTQIATTGFVQNELSQYELEKDYSKEYLTFVALENGTFSFLKGDSQNESIQYSLDEGKTWVTLEIAEWDEGPTIETPTVHTGEKIMWKGELIPEGTYYGIGVFYSTGNYNVEGNIMSLLYGDDFIGQVDLTGKNYVFGLLFSESKIVNAENLILPATILSESCYQSMFQYSYSLIVAPKILPATILTEGCYAQMFYMEPMEEGDVSHLIYAPELPASVLTELCYSEMFQFNQSLNYIKCLATNISAEYCTHNWLYGVSPTGTFIKADSMTSWTTGDDGIPSGWTVYTDEEDKVAKKYDLKSLEDRIAALEAIIQGI